MPVEEEGDAHQTGKDTDRQIKGKRSISAYPYHKRLLACCTVGIAVAEIIHQQQAVNDQSAGQRCHYDLKRQRVQLHIVRGTHGHKAEEKQYKHIAQSYIRQMGGIQEAEHHTGDTHQNHLQSTIEHQRQAHQTSDTRGQRDGMFHRLRTHPPLRTGSLRPQSRLAVIRTLRIVKEVVDKVGIYLHDESEEHAQHRRRPRKRVALICLSVNPGERQPYHHWHGGTRQRLRTGSQHPGLQRILFDIFIHGYRLF